MKKNNEGFSLVELIIIIAVMAILLSVVAVSFIKYIDKTQKTGDIANANLVAKEFTDEYLTNPDLYSAINAPLDADGKTDSGLYPLIAYCNENDTEWTLADTYAGQSKIKEYLDESCSIPKIRYEKSVNPALPGHTNADYVTDWDSFNPKGWGIALIDGKPAVLVTDGSTAGVPKGASLSPVMCAGY